MALYNNVELYLAQLGGSGGVSTLVTDALGSSDSSDYIPSTPGLIQLYNRSCGLYLNEIKNTNTGVSYGKHLTVACASDGDIAGKASMCNPIVPGNMAKAISAFKATHEDLTAANVDNPPASSNQCIITPGNFGMALETFALPYISSGSDDYSKIPNVEAVSSHVYNECERLRTKLEAKIPDLTVKVEVLSKGQEFTLPRSTIAAIFPSTAVLSGNVYTAPAGFANHDIALDEIALVYTTDYVNLPTTETRVAVVYGAKGTLGVPTLKSYHQLYKSGATVKCTSGNTYVYYMSKYA